MAASSEEAAVGVTLHANSCPGFQAILKHRHAARGPYTDFKVNEVDLEGRVVRLTSLEVPKANIVERPDAGEAPVAAPNAASNPSEAVEVAVQRYAAISGASSAQLDPLRSFLLQALQHQAAAKHPRGSGTVRQPAPQPLVLDPAMAAKDQRTAVHLLFKSLPGFPRLETNTVEPPVGHAAQEDRGQQLPQQPHDQKQRQQQQQEAQDGTAGSLTSKPQCIQVQLVGSRSGRFDSGGGRGQKRKWRDDSGWPGGSLRYTKFVLFKENMDSQHAISSLAKLLHVSHKLFAIAGTKDKRGVTVQQVTAFKLDPARLAALNPRLRGMCVGNFECVGDQLRLGDLQGNRFELVLRAIKAESATEVAAAVDALRLSGFINYYGLQRFGTGAVPTHRVGQALLCGQWRDAVRLLLTPRDDCPRPEQAEACRLYLEQGDVEGSLRLMPRFLVTEPTLLQGLKQHGPNGFLNALMMLPRNLRTIYIHAYQSYLWNAAASHRVQTYGPSAVVAGDLVLPYSARQRSAARNRSRPGVPAAVAGEVVETDADAAANEEEHVSAAVKVHVVTVEEAAAGAWRMEDVVLPLPGSEVLYPQHGTADVYLQLAAADGVSLDSSPHGSKDFSIMELTGAYRHLLHRPADLEYELVRYSHPDIDLASTDLMELRGEQLPAPISDKSSDCYLALRLAFTLPSSCYATMLIRELTKQPSSTAHHKALPHDEELNHGGGSEKQKAAAKPAA